MLVSTVLTWAFLYVWFNGIPKIWRKPTPAEVELNAIEAGATNHVEAAIRREYAKLGKISFHEIQVIILFLVLVALWVTGKIGTPAPKEREWSGGWHRAKI